MTVIGVIASRIITKKRSQCELELAHGPNTKQKCWIDRLAKHSHTTEADRQQVGTEIDHDHIKVARHRLPQDVES